MKKKILFVVLDTSKMEAFVEKDVQFLRNWFPVEVVQFPGIRRLSALLPKYLSADLYFCWFGYKHAAVTAILAKLFCKKSVVVAGGFDSVHMPEINYGLMADPARSTWAKRAFLYSDLVLAVSDSIKNDVIRNCQFNEELEAKVHVIYHGFDSHQFYPEGGKDSVVITIGNVNRSNLLRKGHECFIKAAGYLPQYEFVLIGRDSKDGTREYLQSISSQNVKILDFLAFGQLLKYMQKAKVYVQVSAHEGFGCSLAEAMLCGCIPVVSDRGAIPEVVGETGHMVPFNDAQKTAAAIMSAMHSDASMGVLARERVVRLFPLENRERQLVAVIESLNQL